MGKIEKITFLLSVAISNITLAEQQTSIDQWWTITYDQIKIQSLQQTAPMNSCDKLWQDVQSIKDPVHYKWARDGWVDQCVNSVDIKQIKNDNIQTDTLNSGNSLDSNPK